MRKPSGALWSHRDFLKLWTGQTISEFGSQISQLAIPTVAVLTLKATPFQVAALETVVFLPFLLFTLPAGVWVDRWRRRWILIAGDLLRALLLASIPFAYLIAHLTLTQLAQQRLQQRLAKMQATGQQVALVTASSSSAGASSVLKNSASLYS